MSRVQSHRWDNREQLRKNGRYSGWNKRVTWYCTFESIKDGTRDKDIRIKFEDEEGVAHKFYGDDKVNAERDWMDFRHGAVSTTMLRQGK